MPDRAPGPDEAYPDELIRDQLGRPVHRPTIAELLPPKVRAGCYAVLGVANAVYLAAQPLYDVPVWTTLIVAGVNSAGFALSTVNTPTD